MTAWKQETQLLSTLFTSPRQTSPNSSKSCVLCYPQLESGLEAFGKSFHFPLPTPALPLSCPGLVSYEHTKWSWTGSGQRALLQPPPSSPGWSSSLQDCSLEQISSLHGEPVPQQLDAWKLDLPIGPEGWPTASPWTFRTHHSPGPSRSGAMIFTVFLKHNIWKTGEALPLGF